MKKSISKMNRDEIRAEISLLVMAHPEAPRALNIYSDFFTAPTSTRAGRKNNFAIWTRGSAPELVAELRALCDRLDEIDASSRAAAALGRKGGKAKSAAKAAAARANGAKGGRPRVTSWTVREVTERGAVEFSAPAGDGAEIIATLLPDNPEDEAVFAVRATWGEIGPRDGVDADLDTLAGRVAAALPRVGGWGYDSAADAIVQAKS